MKARPSPTRASTDGSGVVEEVGFSSKAAASDCEKMKVEPT